MRKLIIWTGAAACIASAPLFTATAKPKKDLDCGIHYKVCYRGCGVIGSDSDVGEKCRRNCDIDLMKCSDKETKGGRDNRSPGTTGPKGGPVAKDPSLPKSPAKSGSSNSLPKSGTWHGPASPPSKSGPVFHGPATPPKGIGGSGPIFRSGGQR